MRAVDCREQEVRVSLAVAPDEVPVAEFDPPVAGPASIVLGGGCFWCTEAVYRRLNGVTQVVSGYAGDTKATANYKAVCAGITNHAEVIRIDYDASVISLGTILRVFFSVAHDPTQKNRQGNDVGRQYRSAIFHATPEQKEIAGKYIAQLDAEKAFRTPIATTLEPLEAFYPAEDYHQNYAALNPSQPYICAISDPKVQKLRHYFEELLSA
jgi:peptide-methionine (S)-S-oxide reductase